jgi:hypothetical protein
MIPSARDLITPFLTKEELARVEHLVGGTPKVTEVFEKLTDAYPFKAKSASTYSFKSVGEPYIVDIYQYDNRIGVDFGVGTKYDNMTYPETNAGDIYRIMATIVAITKDYISKHSDVEIISWSSIEKSGQSKKGETQRDRIYKLAIKKQFGIDDKDIVDKGQGMYWAYIKGRNGVSEGIVGDEANDFFTPLKGDTTNPKPANSDLPKNLPSFDFKPETNELDIAIIFLPAAANNTSDLEHNDEFIEKLVSLTDYMMEHINIEPLPDINFIEDDVENANDILGKTAYYDPNSKYNPDNTNYDPYDPSDKYYDPTSQYNPNNKYYTIFGNIKRKYNSTTM